MIPIEPVMTEEKRQGPMNSTSPWRMLPLLVVLMLTPACAATGSGGANGERSDRDVLTRAQLESVNHLNAHDAIRRLRPLWLRTERGQDSFDRQAMRGVRVYLDRVNIGNADALRNISIENVQEIRFLDKRKATTEFGLDHAEGAILITSRSS